MKPFAAVQALIHYDGSGKYQGILGSAFRLWSPKHYITANHCLENLSPQNVKILNCVGNDINCKTIFRHPSSDIAVLEVADNVPSQFEQFKIADFEWNYGINICCFGMVCHHGGRATRELARELAGIVQRDLIYNDGKYNSECVELSFPIPRGMSGGPVFLPNQSDTVVGMSIANIRSELVVSSISEYKDQKEEIKERVCEITQYGVALWLHPLKKWLESNIPSNAK